MPRLFTRMRANALTSRHALWTRLGIGALSLSGFLILLLGPITIWATPQSGLHGKDRADAINATRQILLAAVAGVAVLAGAAFTARTYYLSRRGQLTDRYAKAISLLASDKMTERVGGVYALEHLMLESEPDHDTVVEVLAAFIRERSISEADGETYDEHLHNAKLRPDTDVQAALTVIGRRPQRLERNFIDLSRADLCGANLIGANLRGVDLWNARLRAAKLMNANLNGASLCRAQLQHAELPGAHLQGALLIEARLHEAVLYRAHLQGADFTKAQGLTSEQLSGAAIDDRTRLPGELPESIQIQ